MKRISLIMMALVMVGAMGTLSPSAEAHRRRSEINRREHHQMGRIREGVKSGELTKDEAKGLRQDEKNIHKEVREERKENGGHLTAEERKEVNQKLDQESKKIYEEKHNEMERPKADK